ncbi:DDE-type integrase/transposase/recombinase [Lactiplantibacillus plantarum]|uniref:DDE-type integrase/transposase/recombinase n=1 Tax=Lactiplantibacillus plantarum TaxID=1590 RepID=UPI001650EA2A
MQSTTDFPAHEGTGIHSVTVNKWKAASASKTKVEQRPNLLKQDFSTTGLNQKWTADMTYIQTKRNGWCYLSTIMDLHSRRIIGYSFWQITSLIRTSPESFNGSLLMMYF